jgi:hypothetical protein
MRRFIVALAALLMSMPAVAGQVAGVTLPDSVDVNGTTLMLNGMGLRKKAVFKVYVGALYVAAKGSDAQTLIAADTPRRMVMHFVRDVGKDKIVEGWREGFTNNSPANAQALAPKLDEFAALWSDMANGDEAVMTYVQGTGLKLEIRGKEVGLVQGKQFADAVMACWIGPNPPTEELKAGLLGK